MLQKLMKDCKYVLEHHIPIESRLSKIEYHRIIASGRVNPLLMFIEDFIENLLNNAKEILQPIEEFSQKVLNAHRRVYKALLERNPPKAHEEMVSMFERWKEIS